MLGNSFRGGVHPPDGKALSRDCPPVVLEPKGDLVFPVSQHIGKPAKVLVKKGDRVLAGQVLAEADGYVSSPVHCSVSGTVKAVESRETLSGAMCECIVVTSDGKFQTVDGIGQQTDWRKLDRDEIMGRIRAAGIVGMGGASFPTPVKLEPKNPDGIRYIIVNGAECEPYITCDDQLLRLKAAEIVTGLQILVSLFPHAEGVVLIEDNKPEAIEAMRAALAGKKNLRLVTPPVKYPQGGEKSVIKVVAGADTKMSQLPADAGCIVDNAATVYAVYEAVCLSTPLFRRIVSVTGPGVRKPGNFWVRSGTSIAEVVEAAGGAAEDAVKALAGGPMMGLALRTLDVPLQKGSGAVVLLTKDGARESVEKLTACIRCGRCVQACPMGLNPQMMGAAAERRAYGRYEKKLYGLECIQCGCCTYSCPAKRPLTQMFKEAKFAILAARNAAKAQTAAVGAAKK